MREIMKMMKGYLTKYQRKLFFLMFCLLMSSLVSLYIPILTSNFIDYLTQMNQKEKIYEYCIVFVFVSLLGVGFGYIINYLYINVGLLLENEMQQDIIRYVQMHGEVENENSAKCVQQINIDVKTLVDFCFEIFNNFLLNLFKVIVPVLVVAFIDKKIMVMFVGLIGVYTICYFAFRKVLYVGNYELKEKENDYFGFVYEQIYKSKFIRINHIYNWFNEKVEEYFERMYKVKMSLQKSQYLYSGLDIIIMTLGQVLFFLLGGNRVMENRITIGQFTLLFTYFNMEIGSIRYFFSLGQRIQIACVSLNRIKKILNQPEKKDGKIRLRKIESITVVSLELYLEKNKILNDINMEFHMGNRYAILGKNGSGKTTLINTILGFRQQNSGQILYNNILLKNVNMANNYRYKIGYVEQNPVVINSSLYDNICLDHRISEKRVERLLKKWFKNSKFHDLERMVRDELDNISGGEREIIAILRMIVKDPEVIILDEPTAALDNEGVNNLMNLLQGEWKNKMVIIVTHDKRIASICDIQYVLG